MTSSPLVPDSVHVAASELGAASGNDAAAAKIAIDSLIN
jgi:hypothetical protein